MKYEATGEFKPSDDFIILCIAWENTKTSFLCSIKLVDKLSILHHFLYIRMENSKDLVKLRRGVQTISQLQKQEKRLYPM
jgi:hypothetical protein